MANYFGAPGTYDVYNAYNPGAPSYPYRPSMYNPYQPVTPQTPQNVQNGQQNSNIPWIPVPNVEGAKSVMVGPNQTVYMMSQNANEFYVKSTDAMGVATIHCYEFQEFDPAAKAMQANVAQTQNFISRDEFNNFVANVSNQFAAIQQNAMQQPVMTPVNTQQVQPATDTIASTTPTKPTNSKKTKED